MRRILLLVLWQFSVLAGSRLFADVVTLNDGRQISGLVESGNSQELHIKAGDQPQTIDIHQVQVIQFGVSSSVPAAAAAAQKAADPAPDAAPAQSNSLILKDGTHVSGRWWSIDVTNMHFLVNGQLQQYPRSEVSAVTFGGASLPASAPSAPATPPPATPEKPSPAAARPVPTPPARTSAGPAPQAPTLTRPSGSTPPSAPARDQSQSQEIGVVYAWNGKVLAPLERTRAVERKGGSTPYYEVPGPRSTVRLSEDSSLVFVVYLPNGVDPASYSLFPLATVDGGRRTQSQPGRRGGLMTWPVGIEKKNGANIIAYALTVRDLPTGEYSFSPSSSNDSYCFGVDPSAPEQ